jgi:hypothetical protein
VEVLIFMTHVYINTLRIIVDSGLLCVGVNIETNAPSRTVEAEVAEVAEVAEA